MHSSTYSFLKEPMLAKKHDLFSCEIIQSQRELSGSLGDKTLLHSFLVMTKSYAECRRLTIELNELFESLWERNFDGFFGAIGLLDNIIFKFHYCDPSLITLSYDTYTYIFPCIQYGKEINMPEAKIDRDELKSHPAENTVHTSMKSIGGAIKPFGFDYKASISVHLYQKPDSHDFAFIPVLTNLAGIEEGYADVALKELRLTLMKSYGREDKRRKK